MGQMNQYQEYIHKSRYARYLDTEKRRETWEETVRRYVNFFRDKYKDKVGGEELWEKIFGAIYNLDVVPSMRALMTAGVPLDRDNMAGYNCSYLPIDDVRAFDEVMYILMCGTGVGFSVERQEITNLPVVAEEFHESDTTITVKDSKIGWATAYRELIALLYAGHIPKWDVTKVRPAGARLKTFGGRDSGPKPLIDLFKFTIEVFKKAAGRKLNSVEVHDIVCKIADVVVVGGVRRSALISLSNLTDERMRHAKSGAWWEQNPQRALANNSAAYTEKPDIGIFMKEWHALYESKSGERGIFNRVAAIKKSKAVGRRDVAEWSYGTNPCGEIILRPNGLCNLSEVIVRPEDSIETLKSKVTIATILGTLQSTLTNFRYVRSIWRKNAEEERLLGVSLTGIMDNKLTAGNLPGLSGTLEILREHAVKVNRDFAAILGINSSVAITTVKPSGTVSQLVDSSSGIHPRYSGYYIRTVRADNKDPLTQFLKEQGIPNEPAFGKEDSTTVFSFPQKSPEGSVMRNDMTAIEQLEHYAIFQEYWCEHNPSITVYVKEDEWLEVGAWVYKNFDRIGGVSFLPYDGGSYPQAPYQEINKEQYEELSKDFPKINWETFNEEYDNTIASQELACLSGQCEI